MHLQSSHSRGAYLETRSSQQTRNICTTSVQRRPNVFDVGLTLYKINVIQMYVFTGIAVNKMTPSRYYIYTTSKGVPELRGPALICLSAKDKKTVYWSSSWASILNVFLPPPSRELARIHSIFAYDVSRREDVGLPSKFRFNVGPALQLIAGSIPVNRLRRWANTNLSSGLLYNLRKHVAFNQCCFNVDPQSSTLALH